MERTIWIRLGATLRGTEEEIEKLFTEDRSDVLLKILKEGRYEFEGDTYITEPTVDNYNAEYGTNHEVDEYDFYL